MEKLDDIFFNLKLTCNVCGRENGQGYFCKECADKLEYNDTICSHCGRSVINKEERCNSCQNRDTFYVKARSVFRYTSPITELIHGFKYSGKRYLSKIFADISVYLLLKNFADTDFIINVPMHPKDKRKRGYNQTELLAMEISKISGYTFINRLFEKVKRTKRQATLSREERGKNLTQAFKLTDKTIVKGKTVLIIDDCMTTGATVETLAEKLVKAKAKKVYVLTVASVGERELTGRKNKKLSKFAIFLQKMGLHRDKNVVK